MKKLWLCGWLLCALTANAQNAFWSFDDGQYPLTIAPECDARFEEVRGGVFMPTTEEVYQQGLIFLENQSPDIKRQAPYCFLVAALDGNADAQLQLAQLYNKGDILPQDDLSAYKWAFIAALNGNKEAENFTLSLEQFLSTADLEATGPAIQTARLQIQANMQKKLDELNQQIAAKGEELAKDDNPEGARNGRLAPLPTPMTSIFSEQDRFQ